MTFNPSKDGNFQFSAIAHTLTHTLSEYGTFCSPNTLKYEVVEYLRNNPHNAQGFPLDVFKWNVYLQEMSHCGIYEDQTRQSIQERTK